MELVSDAVSTHFHINCYYMCVTVISANSHSRMQYVLCGHDVVAAYLKFEHLLFM